MADVARADNGDETEDAGTEARKHGRSFSIPAMQASDMQRAVLILGRGRELFAAGEYPQATDAFLEVVEAREVPVAAVAEAWLQLGYIARLEGNYSGARNYLAEVINLPRAPAEYRAEAQFCIGDAYMHEGDPRAAAEFAAVLDIAGAPPEHVGRALLYLGRLAYEEYDDHNAERFLQQALLLPGISPADGAAVRLFLGRLAERRERYTAAAEFYEMVLNMPDSSPEQKARAWLGIADVRLAEGQSRQAADVWRRVVDMPAAPMHNRLEAQRRLDNTGQPRRHADQRGISLDFSVWAEAFAGQAEQAYLEERRSFSLFAERLEARPGDRWLELFMDLRPVYAAGNSPTVRAYLYNPDDNRLIQEIRETATAEWGWLRVDLRRHAMAAGRLRVEVYAGRRMLDAVEITLRAAVAEPLTPGARAPVTVDVPAGTVRPDNWPVNFGVPFAAGALWNVDDVRLVDDDGREIPAQKEITGRWAEDGAIKWLRFDALLPAESGCHVEVARAAVSSKHAVRVTEKKGEVTVDTGVARYVLGAGRSPVREIRVGGRRMAFCGPQSRGLYVVTRNDVLGQAADDTEIVVEAAGPLSACVRFEGWYRAADGAPLARHITRMEFFAGHPWTRVTHTLVLTEDTRETWFKDIGWELDVHVAGTPRAVFGVERGAPDNILSLPLDTPTASAYMLQESHYRFYAGTNSCVVMHSHGDAEYAPAVIGSEMGDWAMLAGSGGGLMMACRESARQHPKEFKVRPDRITMRLFSERAGEELDFRASTLVRKWNLEEWFPGNQRASYRKMYERDALEAIAEIDSNAVGWSKTHELFIAPLAVPPEEIDETAARLAHLHSFPVYAQVDPWWIYRSRAMGAIHPYAPEKYPAAEELIEALWRSRLPGGHEAGGRYGFVDYYHGPTYRVPIGVRRYADSYTLRHDLWLACARTWSRELREFTESTTRTWLDNYVAHWDGPRKTAGLFTAGTGGAFDTGLNDLPFFWGNRTTFIKASTTDLHQWQWLHQLAGMRRGADGVRQFGEGLKTAWRNFATTEEILNDRRNVATGRILMALKVLTQSYGFTWDPELRFLANDVARVIYDPDASMGITKRLPRPEFIGSYYKVNEDAGALLDAQEVFGSPRYHLMLNRLGDYLLETGIGMFPISRQQGSLGRLGVFFYDQTRNPWIASALDFQMRWAGTHYDDVKEEARAVGASAVTFVLQGMPMIMDVLERSAADHKAPASWLAFDDYEQPVKVAFRKPHGRALDVWFKSDVRGGITGGDLRLHPLAVDRRGYDQITIAEQNFGLASVHLPLEAPGSDYALETDRKGFHLVFADQDVPLVIYAPSYWQLPPLRPALPVYFRVPHVTESGRQPRILVEGGARFFDPQGQPWHEGEVLQGWVDLPADQPGLWRFEPVRNRLVRAVNLPPFFALGRPETYFEPDLPWEYQPIEAEPQSEPVPSKAKAKAGDETLYVKGPLDVPGSQGLLLTGQRSFKIVVGAEHSSGDGGLFLPYRQGTIEFFFKPYWDTFSISGGEDRVIKPIMQVVTDKTPWNFVYRVDPRGTGIHMGPRESAHSLFGSFWTDGRQRVELRCWRLRTLFERNQWTHIVWSWGPDVAHVGTRRFDAVMRMQIYVDGRGHTQSAIYTNAGNLPEGIPRELAVGPLLNGAIAELRVSDIRRYPANFTPPSRDRGLKLDENTRALFRFNGNLKGESFGYDGNVVGTLEE